MTNFTATSKILVVFLFLFAINSLYAIGQINVPIDTVAILKKTKRVSSKHQKNPVTLAHYLADDFTDDASKVLAFSYWIAKNITYNYEALEDRTQPALSSLQVLKKHRAICGEYAQLMTEMCAAVGIKSAIVGGYVLDYDFFDGDTLYRAEHAWSVIEINGVWVPFDITWASGHSEFKKQFFGKLWWKWFHIPFELKKKNVQQLDPYFLFMDPHDLIYTHRPTMEIYQLLENPIPMGVYSLGYDAITDYNTGDCANYDNNLIHTFKRLSPLEQHLKEGNKGFEDNPSNHRVKGYYYYRAAYDLFDDRYNEEQKIISTSERILHRIDTIATVSDSFLRYSLTDFVKEYDYYEARSLQWKSDLKGINKKLVSELSYRKRDNNNQIKLIKKTKSLKAGTYDKLSKQIKSFSQKKPTILRTQRMKEKVDETEAEKLLSEADSLYQKAVESRKRRTNLLTGFTAEQQQLLISNETKISVRHENNTQQLRIDVIDKIDYAPQIYLDNYLTDKVWFVDEFHGADSLNMATTGAQLTEIYNRLDSANQEIKQFKKLMYNAMYKVKQANKLSAKGNYQSIYDSYNTELVLEYSEYRNQVSSYLINYKPLISILKEETKTVDYAKKTLRKESWFESVRHRQYMKIRKSIKKGESRLVKAIIKEVSYVQKSVDKTYRHIEKLNNE